MCFDICLLKRIKIKINKKQEINHPTLFPFTNQSIRNTVGHQLELVIYLCRDLHIRLADKIAHEFSRVPLTSVKRKPIAEILQRVGLETG